MKNDIEIRIIGKDRADDINIKNEPFTVFGRLIPRYTDEVWSYSVEKFETATEMCFPDENYVYDEMIKTSVFIGAYDGETCIGLAIVRKAAFGYMYLYDLKVNKQYRNLKVATRLIEKIKSVAKDYGYKGVYTQGQDNNLAACLFYLKSGFVIGGLDTKVYCGTPQQDKKDIYFYLDF